MSKQTLDNWENRYLSLEFWFATLFGAGLIKPAPGTWGSLVALVMGIGALVANIGPIVFIVALVVFFIIGTVAINRIETLCGVHDAPEIVIDELVGQWIPLIPLFLIAEQDWTYGWLYIGGAFLLFRFFEPWPIGWIDKRVSGGFGVMIDDVIAGLFAWGVLELVVSYLGK